MANDLVILLVDLVCANKRKPSYTLPNKGCIWPSDYKLVRPLACPDFGLKKGCFSMTRALRPP